MQLKIQQKSHEYIFKTYTVPAEDLPVAYIIFEFFKHSRWYFFEVCRYYFDVVRLIFKRDLWSGEGKSYAGTVFSTLAKIDGNVLVLLAWTLTIVYILGSNISYHEKHHIYPPMGH